MSKGTLRLLVVGDDFNGPWHKIFQGDDPLKVWTAVADRTCGSGVDEDEPPLTVKSIKQRIADCNEEGDTYSVFDISLLEGDLTVCVGAGCIDRVVEIKNIW